MALSFNAMAANITPEAKADILAAADICGNQYKGVFKGSTAATTCITAFGVVAFTRVTQFTKCLGDAAILSKLANKFPVCTLLAYSEEEARRGYGLTPLFNEYGIKLVVWPMYETKE